MSPPATDPARVARISAGAGAVVWLASVAAVRPGTVDALILLAAFVHVPLVVAVIPGRDGGTPGPERADYPGRFYRPTALVQPVGALGLLGAVVLGRGLPAAAALAPWLATIGLLALFGLDRLRRRGIAPLHETLVDAGCLYAVVGGGSYLFHVLGIDLGFPAAILHLTAAHFHYAGLVLPVVTGLAGRRVADGPVRQAYAVGAVTVLGGMPLVAAGITLSRLAGLRLAEFFGATLFAGGVVVLGAVLLGLALAPDRVAAGRIGAAPRILLAVTGLSIVLTMVLAAAYGYARAFDPGLLSISTMIRYHGTTNALGFALPGLLAWSIEG